MATDFYEDAQASQQRSFTEKESRCRKVFEWALSKYGGLWHLCTPGEKQSIIFERKDDYVCAMTLVATSAYDCPDVRIITFELMSNHVHFILCGSEAAALEFFALFKKRLNRYLYSNGKKTDLGHFECGRPIAVGDLESMRNHIAYVNRNNFVVDPSQTPFTYPYGANGYYFNPWAKERRQTFFGKYGIKDKRQLVHSKSIDYPDTYTVVDGYFSPVNYCRLDIGEGVFRDARHYFYKIAKDIESYRDIAALAGDSVFYTDDELFDVVRRECRQKYNGERAVTLGWEQKLELARTLHFDYNAGNAKIARLLKLTTETLDEIFPLSRRDSSLTSDARGRRP